MTGNRQIKPPYRSLLAALRDTATVDEIAAMLEAGANINEADSEGSTMLIEAISMGRFDVAHLLIDKGALLDKKNDAGFTVLHIASIGGFTDVVRHLCDKGADITLTGQHDRTALMLAERHHHPEVAKILKEAAAREVAKKSHVVALQKQRRFKQQTARIKIEAVKP